MKDRRVYADLNKWDEIDGQFRVILTTRGTHQDLQKYGINLEEGRVLDFWTDDGDADGNLDPLYFQGIVHYDEARACWIADVNPDAIRHASELKEANVQEPVLA